MGLPYHKFVCIHGSGKLDLAMDTSSEFLQYLILVDDLSPKLVVNLMYLIRLLDMTPSLHFAPFRVRIVCRTRVVRRRRGCSVSFRRLGGQNGYMVGHRRRSGRLDGLMLHLGTDAARTTDLRGQRAASLDNKDRSLRRTKTVRMDSMTALAEDLVRLDRR